jgi:hypothetical protein
MNTRPDRSAIFASRLFSRRRLDVRARVVALNSTIEHGTLEHVVVHARTFDISRGGAGLTLTRELPWGSEVVLCFRLPGNGTPLCLHAVITRRQGFRVGLRFVQPTAEQRLLLCELCYG